MSTTSSISAASAAAVAQFVRVTLRDFPPPHPGQRALPVACGSTALLGAYLLQLGYVTPDQIANALGAPSGLPLGDTLVAQGLLHPQALTAALLLQMIDRVLVQPPALLQLGEFLVASHQITPLQLVPALQIQGGLRRRGIRLPLGALLVQQGCIDYMTLEASVRRRAALQAVEASHQKL